MAAALSLSRWPFHLAATFLGLLLLPHPAAAAAPDHLLPGATPSNDTISLPLTPPPFARGLRTARRPRPRDGSSSAAAILPRRPSPAAPPPHGAAASSVDSAVAPRAAADQRAATASSPRHRARRVLYTRYGVTLADVWYVCRPPFCFADSNHRLLSILYGRHRHAGSRWGRVYCVARTIEGSPTILPFAWRAFVYAGGDVCHVELARVDPDDGYGDDDCPAWTCARRCTRAPEEALAWAVDAIATPCGGVTSGAAAVLTPSPPNALALLLPLLAAAFLPRPLAAAVALSTVASLAVAADLSGDEYTRLNHATCTVFVYDDATGSVDRARPVPGLRAVCPRPLCIDADDLDQRTLSVTYAERHGRRDDPLRAYCAVHSLEGASSPSVFFPWRNTWRAHLPVADPGAPAPTATAGGDVCYVELAHMDYREGYYIHCPGGSGGHAQASCTEFPDEAVASAVWEHRSRTYRDTVGPKCERFKYGAAAGQFWDHDYNADL